MPAFKVSLSALQPLGRSLMLPIAVLPVAGLLLRLGQPDLLNIPFVAAAGDAIFHNLGLLFAIGVAVGFARDGNGAAGLAGVVCYLVAANGAQALMTTPNEALGELTGKARDLADAAFKAGALNKLGVPLGILSGLISGTGYNRFGAVKLPDYLAFFGGRRFVPIVSGFAGLLLAVGFGMGWGALSRAIDGMSRGVVAAGPLGLFVYGALNRLLIVTGLHHILNNIAWFILGDYHGATGDLNRFFAGDPEAGAFMSGFFPIMMFGLPAACLAMYHSARRDRRAMAGGLLTSLALTALLTGVTEPIEFSFMFLAPVLYLLHAILTGLSMMLMDALGVRLGFSFSAGLFDYAINFGKATRPLLLIPIGLLYAGIYYGVFRYAIVRFDLKTPGREADLEGAEATESRREQARGQGFLAALGGAENLTAVDACTTRLRLIVVDQHRIDPAALKRLGARGVIRPSERDLQVVVGPIADEVAREMRLAMGASPVPALQGLGAKGYRPVGAVEPERAQRLLAALGGWVNVSSVEFAANRLLVGVKADVDVNVSALRGLGVRALARPQTGRVQVILGEPAAGLAEALKALRR